MAVLLLPACWYGVSAMGGCAFGSLLYAAKLRFERGLLEIALINEICDRNESEPVQLSPLETKRLQLEEKLNREVPELTGAEGEIADAVVDPSTIAVSLADVGGLQSMTKSLREEISLPLTHPHLFPGGLLSQPKGVLMYGTPGTGKTMAAMAIARDADAAFISLRASTIKSKWVGESEKLAEAVFSLAAKIAPAVVFIDEVDGLLGVRRQQDDDHTTSLKNQILQLWDGMETNRTAKVVVMGATNRQADLDEAALRRFEVKINVPSPDREARADILSKILWSHRAAGNDVDAQLLPPQPRDGGLGGAGSEQRIVSAHLREVAGATDGYSGSDLKALCKKAAKRPVLEFVHSCPPEDLNVAGTSQANGLGPRPRPLMHSDLRAVIQQDKSSRADVQRVQQNASSRAHVQRVNGNDSGQPTLPGLLEELCGTFAQLQQLLQQPASAM